MIRRWETNSRYYVASLETDLLGDVVLICAHGGKHNRLGQVVTKPVASLADGLDAMNGIAKKRHAHHYIEVVLKRD